MCKTTYTHKSLIDLFVLAGGCWGCRFGPEGFGWSHQVLHGEENDGKTHLWGKIYVYTCICACLSTYIISTLLASIQRLYIDFWKCKNAGCFFSVVIMSFLHWNVKKNYNEVKYSAFIKLIYFFDLLAPSCCLYPGWHGHWCRGSPFIYHEGCLGDWPGEKEHLLCFHCQGSGWGCCQQMCHWCCTGKSDKLHVLQYSHMHWYVQVVITDNWTLLFSLVHWCKTSVLILTMLKKVYHLQVFGGNGFNSDYPVEKLMRDAKIYQVNDHAYFKNFLMLWYKLPSSNEYCAFLTWLFYIINNTGRFSNLAPIPFNIWFWFKLILYSYICRSMKEQPRFRE